MRGSRREEQENKAVCVCDAALAAEWKTAQGFWIQIEDDGGGGQGFWNEIKENGFFEDE